MSSNVKLWISRVLTGIITLALMATATMKIAHVPKMVDGLKHAGIPDGAVVPIAILERPMAARTPADRTESDPSERFRVDESVSMAFLVLLERLTPVERAVLLLREVFDYEYAEIGQTLGQNEANCRQILRRARQHVAEVRPRFDASLELRQQLLHQFVSAASTGDLNGLVALLYSDLVFHADGGGKAGAVPNLVYGSDNVARAVRGGVKKLVPQKLVSRMAEINGEPGLVSYVNGRPFSVLTLDIADGLVRNIHIVTNPEKLALLPELPAAPC